MLKTRLVIVLLVCSFFGFGQNSFEDSLKDLRSRYKRKSDTTAYFQAIDSLKIKYKDSLLQCPHNYLLAKYLGGFHFNVLWDDNGAAKAQREVLSYQLECLDSNDVQLAITYFNIGQPLDYLGDSDLAEKYYLKAIKIQNKLESPHSSTSNLFSEISVFYRRKGDYSKALFYNTKAEASHLSGEDKTYRNLLRSQGNLLEMMGDYSEAIPFLNKSLKITRELNEDNPELEILINDDLSRVYKHLTKYDLAEKYALHSINLAKQSNSFTQSRLNDLLTNYSTLLWSRGKYDKALELLLKTRKEYTESKNFKRLSGNYENVGDVYFNQGKIYEALNNYQEGLQYLDFNLSDDIHDNPNIANRQFVEEEYLSRQLGLKTIALLALAKKEENQKYYNSCLTTYLKFDSLNTRLFQEDWEEKSYLSKLKESESIHHAGFSAALQLYQRTNNDKYLNSAYDIISRLKSQLLFRGIKLEESKEELLSEETLAHEKKLKDSLTAAKVVYQKLLGSSSEKRKEAFDKFSRCRIDLNLFQSQTPGLLKNQELKQTAGIKDIQILLTDEEALLEYYLHGDSLYTFVIENNNLRLNRSELSSEKILETYAQLNEGRSANSILSTDLKNILNSLNQKKLIIIPDKELLQIPFEAVELDKNRRLIDKFEISYQYASGFIFDTDLKVVDQQMACFGSDYSTSRFEVYNDFQNSDSKISPLNRTIPEVNGIFNIMGGSKFLNEESNKNAFLNSLHEHGMFHFALHGNLNMKLPDLSALIFESEGDDFELTASEIYNLKIPSNLTVLSACNTGAGPIEMGDGVRSLTRSFIHAGSKSVITSLWESADASTQEIMEKFYTYLSEGKRKSKALQLAKLDYLESASPTFRHPKYWAHLVLVGDSHALENGFPLSNYLPWVLLVFFLALAYWIWNKKR